MHRKVLMITGLCLAVILFGIGFAPVNTVYADPFLQDAPSLEGYKIYFTEANGEASRFDRSINGLSRLAGLLGQLGATLETLEWRTGFPDDADLVLIAGPTSDFNADQTARLWTYMNEGGRVLLLADPPGFTNNRLQGLQAQNGLFQLTWIDLGIRGANTIVVTEGGSLPEMVIVSEEEAAPPVEVEAEATEEATAEATAEVEAEATEEATAEPAPPVIAQPLSHFTTTEVNREHPIMQGLDGRLAFFGARLIDVDLSVRQFPVDLLAFSPGEFYGENNIGEYDVNDFALYNIGEDTPPGFLPISIAYENPNTGMRLVLIGDRDFATNGYGLQSSPPNTSAFTYPDNPRALLNSVTWLLDTDAVETSFPTPGPTATATLTPTPGSVVIGTSDLSVEMTVSNERPVEAELILYTVTVINNGPSEATNVALNPLLPNGLAFVLTSGGTYNSGTGVWSVDYMEPGGAATLRLLAEVRRGTVGNTLTNTIRIAGSDSDDPDETNNEASIDVRVIAGVLEEE